MPSGGTSRGVAGALLASAVVLLAANLAVVGARSGDDDAVTGATDGVSAGPGASSPDTTSGVGGSLFAPTTVAGGTAPSATTAAGGSRGSGPGATATTVAGAGATPDQTATGGTITLGFHFSSNLDAVFKAFGANRESVDVEKTIGQMVADVNKRGGIGGRKVVAVAHGTDPTNGTFDAQMQAACSDFTEDHKVNAVIGGAINHSRALLECLGGKGVPFLWSYQVLVDRSEFKRHPGQFFMPSSIASDRLGVVMDELYAAGFFGNGARVGIIRYDTPIHAWYATNVIRPRLAAHGIQVVEEQSVREPPSASSAGDTAGQLSSVVLKMRQARVSHLILSPSGGQIPFIMGPIAESQGWHPRYGISSLDIPAFVATNTPAAQLKDSMAIGWWPASDLLSRDPRPANPAEERCFAVTGTHASDAQRFCDGLYALEAAITPSTPMTQAGIGGALHSLGNRPWSPWSLGTNLGPSRPDGGATVRMLAFNDTCVCYRYQGATKTAP